MIGLKNISHNNWKIGIHVPICHPQRDSDATELLSVIPVSWSYFIINSIPAKAGFLLLAAQGEILWLWPHLHQDICEQRGRVRLVHICMLNNELQ